MPMPPSLIFVITGVPDSSETLQKNTNYKKTFFIEINIIEIAF